MDAFLSSAYAIQIRPGALVHIWMEKQLKPGIITSLNYPGTTRFSVDATLLEDEYCVRSIDISRIVGSHLREDKMLQHLHHSGFNQTLTDLRKQSGSDSMWEELLPTLWTAKDREKFAAAMKR